MRILTVWWAAVAVVHGSLSEDTAGVVVDEYGEEESAVSTTVAPSEASFNVTRPASDAAAAVLASKWTAKGINATYGQNTEHTSTDRFKLQNALSAAAPGKVNTLTSLVDQETAVENLTNGFLNKVANVSNIVRADSSAGGVAAVTKDLMGRMPRVQEFMSKTMREGLAKIQDDALVVRSTIKGAESDYRDRIGTSAETVAGVIMAQDALQARMAAAQAKAVSQSANVIQLSALNDLSDSNNKAAGTIQKVDSTNDLATKGVTAASNALSDAQDALEEVASDFTAQAGAVSSDLLGTIVEVTDKAVSKVTNAGDAAVTRTESTASAIGSGVVSSLSKVDRNATGTLTRVLSTVTSAVSDISKTADSLDRANYQNMNRTFDATANKIASIGDAGNAQSADALRVAQDTQSMLNQQQSMAGSLFGAFQASLGKVGSLVTRQVGGLVGSAQQVAGGVNSDSSGELARQNAIIAYLMRLVASDNARVSGSARQSLAAAEQAHGSALADRQSAIVKQSSLLSGALSGVTSTASQKAGEAGNNIDAMAGTYSGSIAELLNTIADSESGNELGSMKAGLASQASSGFAQLIQALKTANADGSDNEQKFVASSIGPVNDETSQKFQNMKDLLNALLAAQSDQETGQTAAMQGLSGLQQMLGQQTVAASQKLRGIFALSSQLGDAVGSSGDSQMANSRQVFLQKLFAQVSAAKTGSQAGLSDLEKSLQAVSRTGGPNGTLATIAQLLAGAGANLDNGSSQLTDAQKAQQQAITQLSAYGISSISQSSNQGQVDQHTTEQALASAEANIVARFKELAGTATDNQLGTILTQLELTGNNSAIVNELLGDVQKALSGIRSDAQSAQGVSDQRKSELNAFIAKTSAQVQADQAALQQELADLINNVQNELNNKTTVLAQTGSTMNDSLAQIRTQVQQAQTTLAQNLGMYQEKLEQIIAQIRSYMNMSGNADELAIRTQMAQQLSKVNSTEIAVASANAAVAAKIQLHSASLAHQTDAEQDILSGVIQGAVDTEGSMSDGETVHNQKLAAIAMNVDGASTTLESAMNDGSDEISSGIASSTANAKKGIKQNEADESVLIKQINGRASDVSEEARRNFVNNLDRMGSIDGNTRMVAAQLAALLNRSNSTISDITQSAMDHMDLSVQTMANLNSQQATQVATVSDIMGAFTSVLTGFLDETKATISSVMANADSQEGQNKMALHEIDSRSTDERNWISSSLHKVSSQFSQFITPATALQTAVSERINSALGGLKIVKANFEGDSSKQDETLTQLKQNITASNNAEMDSVRQWISDRDPALTKKILATMHTSTGSFLEASSAKHALIGDIRRRMNIVREDLQKLHKV